MADEAGNAGGVAGDAGAGGDTGAGGSAGASESTALGGTEGAAANTALGGEGTPNAAQTSVPESYEDFAAPEGTKLTPEQQEGFKKLAKENGFSQDVANKAIAMHLGVADENTKAADGAWTKQVGDWLTESKADAEFGGQNYDANVKVALKAIEKFGSPGLQAALNTYGLGNHPEFIRFAFKVGQVIKDDDIEAGGKAGSGSGEKSMEAFANRIYG